MSELVQKEQIISIVPQDFRNANKGKVLNADADRFLVEALHPPKGILLDNLIEFYSQTPNGVLYFVSDVVKIEGNILTVLNPVKHRFLQRRKFTRIKFIQEMDFNLKEQSYPIKTIDLSAGGMRLVTRENIDINSEYDVCIQLSHDQTVNCRFQPIRIEKKDEGFYTISGRFQNLSNVDRMVLVQFCMNKNMENINK